MMAIVPAGTACPATTSGSVARRETTQPGGNRRSDSSMTARVQGSSWRSRIGEGAASSARTSARSRSCAAGFSASSIRVQVSADATVSWPATTIVTSSSRMPSSSSPAAISSPSRSLSLLPHAARPALGGQVAADGVQLAAPRRAAGGVRSSAPTTAAARSAPGPRRARPPRRSRGPAAAVCSVRSRSNSVRPTTSSVMPSASASTSTSVTDGRHPAPRPHHGRGRGRHAVADGAQPAVVERRLRRAPPAAATGRR